MLSQILLCFLVGFAAATDYAWKSNTEYQYDVEGRTLAGLHEVADQYAGVVMRASLKLQLRGENILVGKIHKAQYAQIHTYLPDGWDSEIPHSKLNYQSMPLTQKPFEVRFKNGTVQEFHVEKDISNWEANVLKSIVTQIQVDLQGENAIQSRYNRYPEHETNSAMFKTMEDAVTGKCETLYDINELPEYIIQTRSELVPLPHLRGDGDFIEVVKTRNYSNCDERIGYHYGLHEMHDMEPASSSMGDFFSKSSVSRVILSGNLKRHTIQSSVTTNKIVMKPTPTSDQKGLVVSSLNITLVSVKAASEQPQQLSQPQNLGNLVYKYNHPYASSNEARQGSRNSEEHNEQFEGSSDSNSDSSSSEEYKHGIAEPADEGKYMNYRRQRRSVSDSQEARRGQYAGSSSSSDSSTSQEDSQNWRQDKPTLASPPHTPLLPYYVGYMGQAIKQSQKFNIVEAVQKLAHQIAHELQDPSRIPREDTLATFTILCRLLRTMNVKEIQEAGREIYTLKNKEARPYTDAWKTYRDAVAQAGTGPALVTIQDWILSRKIQGQEAATVLATLAHSTRQPTEEYIRAFYVLATKQEVQKQAWLNDTAILSFTELVRKVYVDKEESHNEYPVHSFGKFYKQNREAVKNEYIPYLAQQLKRAVSDADSHKIQVYIRALGNVAHRQILGVFEPYLEGKKDMSDFQRLFMVISLDQLVANEPEVARPVLYKIYQNQGEESTIRVAAVYQLMKTSPPASMLQRMAESTNEDSDEYVNAAVKSTIESAAELQDPEYFELASNAQTAAPLLTETNYGVQYSRHYLRDYFVREMNLVYKQSAAYWTGEDSIIPQGIMYSLRANMGGVKRQYLSLAAMVSSVEDLFEVFNQQTEKYEPEQQRNAQHSSKWASEQIAKILNIREDEREQLEGNFHLGVGQIKRFFSWDNHTIEQLPQYLKEISSTLRQGHTFNYTKFLNPHEMTLSFPTAMGYPFVYTLDSPILVSINGHVRVKSHPELVSGNKIHVPEYLNLTSEVEVVVSSKTQAKIGFITPFDHQHYIAGYDKKVQVYLPLEADIDVDMENNQVRFEVQPIDNDSSEQIFHYSSWPYTAKKDILQLKPVSQLQTSQLVYQEREPQHFERVFGEQTGMAFRVKYTGDYRYMDCQWLYQQYQRHQGLSYLLSPWTEDYLTVSNLTVEYDAKRSNAESVIVQMGWNQTYVSGKQSAKEPSFDQIFSHKQQHDDYEERQEYFLEKAAEGINSVDASVYDFSVQFTGQKYSSYNATLAIGKSTVDKKSRVLFYYKKESQQSRPFEICLSSYSQIPNTNALDFAYALKFDPTSTSNVQLAYGEQCHSGSKMNLKSKLYKSEERQRYLEHHPMSKVCMQEMKEGNQQLEACRNMTTRANLLDRYNFDISYENVSPFVRNVTYKLYSAARHMGYHYLDENLYEGHGHSNQLKIQARFEPDFRTMNVSLATEKAQAHFNNIRLSYWVRPFVVVHPVFAAPSRFMGIAQQDIFRPTCVVDKDYAETFDNNTYPIHLGKTWYVMMHYRANYNEESQSQRHHAESRFQSEDDYDYAIFVRDSGNNQKDIKIVLNNEKNFYEIDMIPNRGNSQQAGQVLVNQKPVEFDHTYSYDIEGDLVKIYALPNGEIKIEVNDDFYVIYDGERAKLTSTNDIFRDDIVGLCGTFDGQEDTDFLTPKNCILKNPHEFAATYAIIDESSQGPAKDLQKQAYKSACYPKEVSYTNVISNYDIYGKSQKQHGHGQGHHDSTASCSKQQTQYLEEEQGSEICFTIRPLPVCRSPCKPAKKIVKNVEVHCVQKSNVSQLWKKQIEKGSSPDFSLKPVTKTIKIKVAQSCSA